MPYLIVLLLFLSACASGVGANPPPRGIVVADSKMVVNCEYIGDVHGTSPFYGVFVNAALKSARQTAMKEALSLRATHIVFTSTSTTYGATAASGLAYRCH